MVMVLGMLVTTVSSILMLTRRILMETGQGECVILMMRMMELV